jgi:NADH-quinone oxidoreductase subunit N
VHLVLAAAAATDAFKAPTFDLLTFAPEIILVAVLALTLLIDAFTDDAGGLVASLTSIGLLAAIVPVVIMAGTGHEPDVFGSGTYMVDNYALVLKALFLLSAYLVVLISMNYVGEGDYWESEYYQLILSSVIGMTIMASARDLISMFIALELLSIPAYMLAAWRKRDLKSDEAGMKYYLMGVFASAVMLYGMSLLYGITGETGLAAIADRLGNTVPSPMIAILAIVFVLVGFGFKVSAVPFHQWAPDVYEGAPTPVTAFLAVASKAAGFVALMTLVVVGFRHNTDIFQPMMWGLSAVTMVVGNLIALRQNNVVRMLAYSGIAQAGYMLAPLAVFGTAGGVAGKDALSSIISYLVIYAFMNLGAFAVVIAVARKTRSAEVESMGGLFGYAPGLTVAMTIFLFSLAGIPPLGGWFAKFGIFSVLTSAGTASGYTLAVLVGVNSVIALFYYARIAKTMWMDPAPDGDVAPIRVPVSLRAAVTITAVLTLAIGIYPGVVTRFTDNACLPKACIDVHAGSAAPTPGR